MFQKILVVILILTINVSHASIENDLQDFFKSVGMNSNVTGSGAFQDQSAGYYTGGSFMARNQIKSAQPATLQLPGYRAGCGGIDAWTGGFSHISAKELVGMLKNIGSAAVSYAFLLSIQTLSPQVYNIMNELNALATKMNHLNINSCEAAATLLGGVWPKSDQSSKHLCQAMGTSLGSFSDWSAARQGCGAKGNRSDVLSRHGSDPKYKDMLVGEFNLSWRAIQTNNFLKSDQQLSELFMTLVGSIISVKKGDSYLPQVLPSGADQDNLLNGLLIGGEVLIYSCDSDQCLTPTLRKIGINEVHSFRHKVHQTLESLINKIYDDTLITPEEKDFLNSTRLPVYKMLNVTTAFTKGTSPLNVHQYGDLIALDILYKYVMDVIDLVHDSVTQLKSVQVDDTSIERFLKQLRMTREKVILRRNNAFQHMDNVLSFIQSTQLIEKQLHTMLGGVANENNWF